MPKAYRRRPTKIDEMPGLWDIQPSGSQEKEMVESLLSKHRKRQTTPAHAMKSDEIERRVLEATVRPNELEFMSFGNGSSGNCAYIGIRGVGGVIIDAGVDAKKVEEELKKNYISLEKISGIILTHDHSDHVKYVYQLVRKNPKMTIYCTPRTLTGMLRRHNLSKRIKDFHKPIFKEFEFDAGPFKITPFEVSHDGSDNVGFSIKAEDKHFVVATDMGKVTDRADYYMRNANYLMIESNYDRRMLDIGRYPEYLKARIRSDRGHLDNAVTAAYLAEIWSQQLTDVYLCHLSNDNNTPDIAIATSRQALIAKGISVGDGSGSSHAVHAQVQLSALPRYDASPLYIHRL